MVDVTVRLTDDAVDSAVSGTRSEMEQLRRVLREFRTRLEPLHPDEKDATLRSYFRAVVPARDAPRLTAQLLDLSVVDAAYVKPAGSAPAGR